MKQIAYIFLIFVLLNSCISKKENIKYKTKNIMTPMIDKNFEKFDFVRYNSRNDKSSQALREIMSNGNYVEMVVAKAGCSYSEILENSYFKISKGYYVNGNIRLKGKGFNGSAFTIGIWYEFDESGKLIKETDYDKPYKFTFEEIVKFCENEKIPLQKGSILQSTGYHTVIRRDFNADSSWWQIEWLKKPNVIEIITLDGNTGKILKRQDTDYTNN